MKRVALILPGNKQMKTPGMYLVAVSWVVDKTSFGIDVNKVDGLSREELLKIGKGKITKEKLSYIVLILVNLSSWHKSKYISHHGFSYL